MIITAASVLAALFAGLGQIWTPVVMVGRIVAIRRRKIVNKVLFALFVLVASPAFAKDVTFTMNDDEQKVFLALLDGALKQGGLANLQAVIAFVNKYQKAVGPVAAPKPPEPAKTPEK